MNKGEILKNSYWKSIHTKREKRFTTYDSSRRDVFIRTPTVNTAAEYVTSTRHFSFCSLFLSKERGKRDFINLAREFSLAVWGMNTEQNILLCLPRIKNIYSSQDDQLHRTLDVVLIKIPFLLLGILFRASRRRWSSSSRSIHSRQTNELFFHRRRSKNIFDGNSNPRV